MKLLKQIFYHLFFLCAKNSKFFNFEFYQRETIQEFRNKKEAFFHYAQTGFRYGYDPSEYFPGSLFSYSNHLFKKKIKNPLLFFLLNGFFLFESIPKSSVGYEIGKSKNSGKYLNEKDLLFFLGNREKPYFVFSHHFGGGAEKFLKEELVPNLVFQNEVFIIRSVEHYPFLVEIQNKKSIRVIVKKIIFFDHLYRSLIANKASFEIIINHLISFSHDIGAFRKLVPAIKRVYIHDYSYICPFWFCAPKDIFCFIPNEQECNICISKNSKQQIQIRDYRDSFSFLWKNSFPSFFPSKDSLKNFSKIIKHDNFILLERSEVARNESFDRFPIENELNIGILGSLNIQKGHRFVSEMVSLSSTDHLIKFYLIGKSEPRIPDSKQFSETGPYKDEEVLKCIQELKIHIFWFPGRIPETYSYTLSYAMETGFPIVAPNVGAFSERLEDYPIKFFYNVDDHLEKIYNLFLDLKERIKSGSQIFEEQFPEFP